MDYIECRTETEAPTEPGWYWAKMPAWKNAEPVRISERTMSVFVVAWDEALSTSKFRWFGPVTMVKESGAA